MIWKLNKGCQNTASADMDTCSEYKSEQKEGSHMLEYLRNFTAAPGTR